MEEFLEDIEKKITKTRKNSNNKNIVLMVLTIFAITFAYAMEMTKMYRTNKTYNNEITNANVYDSLEYLKNIEVFLTKLQITEDTSQSSKILAEIWKQSNLAKSNIVKLPSTQETVENASTFLSQLSDYSYTLMKKTIKNEKIDESEEKTIVKLTDYAVKTRNEMAGIVEDLEVGKIHWNEVEKALKEESKNEKKDKLGIETIGKVFQDYEGLIYDGAFSDHVLNIKPKMLQGEEITASGAKEKVKQIFKDMNISEVKYVDNTKGKIEAYNIEVKLEDGRKLETEVTKKDGYILSISANINAKNKNIKIDEAKKKGKDFLEKCGYRDMKDTYYSVYENVATINYAYYKDNTVFYPDLIKVRISLDNGEICGLESSGYLFNHDEKRSLDTNITMEEAKEKVNKKLVIESSNLAYIPTESKSEILTYEFKGKINEKYFLVYINANTGIEEDVLLIIDSENGILTM